MPLPFIPLIAIAASAGLTALGAKKGVDAYGNYSEASNVSTSANAQLVKAVESTTLTKDQLSSALERLGRLRFEIQSEYLRKFVLMIEQIQMAAGTDGLATLEAPEFRSPKFAEMKAISFKAANLLEDGLIGLSAGTAISWGATGIVANVGLASTGTAIGSLSGAAATNATLAWLGGGSLATGGAGIAGGTAVLGGLIAGPLVAVMGYAVAKRSEVALSNAYEYEAECLLEVERLSNARAMMHMMIERSFEIENVTSGVFSRFKASLVDFGAFLKIRTEMDSTAQADWAKASLWAKFVRWVMRRKYVSLLSFSTFSEKEKDRFRILYHLAIQLNELTLVEVMDANGKISKSEVPCCEL